MHEAAKHTSVWLDTTPDTSFAPLAADTEADVVVIGGGIAGLTTAYLLAMRGKSVLLLEADRIVSGVTGFTTAKLTTNHGLIYTELIQRFGIERGRMYAEANEAGRSFVLSFCRDYGVDADLDEMPSYTYGPAGQDSEHLQQEARSASSLGLPASYAGEVDLPFPTSGAVRFDGQHVFHPRKYLLRVADEFVRLGGRIHEQSRASGLVDGPNGCTVSANGATVASQDVVVATNYPTYDPSFFFARLGHIMSYVIAVSLGEPLPRGMYYSTDKSGHSVRSHRLASGRELLLVGGLEHPVGKGGNTVENYERLEQWARANFDVRSVDYYWCTHDAEPYDHVPMVGKATSSTDRVYVATGFRGWGMTNATAAAMIIADEIVLQESPWSAIFNPSRLESFFSKETLKSNVTVMADMAKGRMSGSPANVEDLAPGQAGVFERGGKKLAVYRDGAGAFHRLSASCTHLGCIVEWNQAEQTWDCPCHGSRFSKEGRVIHAPAIRDLEPE